MSKFNIDAKINFTKSNNGNNTTTANNDRTENWVDLASMLQEKANKRLGNLDLLTSRASIMIAAIAFLIPCIFNQDLDPIPLALIAILMVGSFVCMAISIFSTTAEPINPDEAISMLESERHCNITREQFSNWKARNCRDSLKVFDKQYARKRHWQIASFALLGAATALLFLFKYVTIVTI